MSKSLFRFTAIILIALSLFGCGAKQSELGSLYSDSASLALPGNLPMPDAFNTTEISLERAGTTPLVYGWNTFTFPAIGVKSFGATTLTLSAQIRLLDAALSANWISEPVLYYQRRWFQLSAAEAHNMFQPGIRYWLWCYKKGAGLSFTKPYISNLTPASGPSGTEVTLSGVNFKASQGNSVASFNGIPAACSFWSDTRIICVAPGGEASGPVRVNVGGESSNSDLSFSLPRTYYVNPSTGNDGNDGTMAHPFRTLTQALNNAGSGEAVCLAAGRYTRDGGENFPLSINDSVTVRGGYNSDFSGHDPQTYETILDAQSNSGVIDFEETGGSTRLEYCTVTGGSRGSGGGIYCGPSAAPVISNCVIRQNSADGNGGGIYCEEATPTLVNCIFSQNQAHNFTGGGLYCYSSSTIIDSCTFSYNVAFAYGGGMAFEGSSQPEVRNCLIRENSIEPGTGGEGGGIYLSDNATPLFTNCNIVQNSADDWGGGISFEGSSSPSFTNCNFIENYAGYGAAGIYANDFVRLTSCNLTGNTVTGKDDFIYGGGGILLAGQAPQITFCNFYGNFPDDAFNDGPGSVSDFANWGWNGTGCLSALPLFVNPVALDFHLQAGSPCLNAGDPDYSGYLLDGNWETQAGIPDIAPADIGYHYHR